MRITVPAAVAALAAPDGRRRRDELARGQPCPVAASCDPFTSPVYAGNVPSPTDVLGFELGSQEVTSDEAEQYLRAVDDASSRRQGRRDGGVRAGPRALVRRGGQAEGRPAAQAAAKALRNPRTSKARAARIADRAPAIAWVAGNVHGNEESGTDAALQVLRDLDRPDRLRGAARSATAW